MYKKRSRNVAYQRQDRDNYRPVKLLNLELPKLNVKDIRNKIKAIAFETAPEKIYKVHGIFNVTTLALDPIDELTKISFRHDQKMLDIFYFHHDHLGSPSYITNFDGIVSQHMEYFISVDPMAEKIMSSYGYCYNNPIKFVDPTGMEGLESDLYYFQRHERELFGNLS